MLVFFKPIKTLSLWLGYRALFVWNVISGRFYTPIVVFSIAKTGTTSVKVTLRRQLPNPVYHAHHLSRAHFAKRMWGLSPRGWVTERKDLWLRNLIDSSSGQPRWKVIILTREPVARAISAVFEIFESRHMAGQAQVTPEEFNEFILEQTTDFNDSMFTAPDQWFDQEALEVWGWEAYSAAFDPTQGYGIYQTPKAEILVLRLEDLSRVGAQALGEFLGVAGLKLFKANERAATVYQAEYQQVLETLSLPAEFLERLYATRYAQHFYTPAEIEKFKRRWVGDAHVGVQA